MVCLRKRSETRGMGIALLPGYSSVYQHLREWNVCGTHLIWGIRLPIPETSLPNNRWDLNSGRKPLSGILFFTQNTLISSLFHLFLCFSMSLRQWPISKENENQKGRRRRWRKEMEKLKRIGEWGAVRSSREIKNNWRMGKKNQKKTRRRIRREQEEKSKEWDAEKSWGMAEKN